MGRYDEVNSFSSFDRSTALLVADTFPEPEGEHEEAGKLSSVQIVVPLLLPESSRSSRYVL